MGARKTLQGEGDTKVVLGHDKWCWTLESGIGSETWCYLANCQRKNEGQNLKKTLEECGKNAENAENAENCGKLRSKLICVPAEKDSAIFSPAENHKNWELFSEKCPKTDQNWSTT
jgi:hypothetical protein